MNAGWVLLHGALLLGMVLTAASILWIRNLVAGAIALAVFSLMMALEFYLLQAPDVAIAEAGIGAGLTTAIFIVAIMATRSGKTPNPGAPEDEGTPE
ncbi:MAG: DUF4040 domain-containing protein [Verrucomicrobiota bacterium]|jgi:uncharacterized MnhB-related membrane protein|nr:DUF4040 domain-containing protein [Verrucomicrobiota bacterium]